MGYRPQKKIYELTFVDYPGLEISMHSIALGKLMNLSQLNLKLNEPDEDKRMEAFTAFSGALVRWNMEHPEIEKFDEENKTLCYHCKTAEGAPLPPTVLGLMCLDLSMVMSLIFGWIGALTRVSVPKEMNLSNGESNIEDILKMLAQHQNLSTLPMPS